MYLKIYCYKMELRNDAVYQIVGPSGSGKTLFVCKLLKSYTLF